MFGYKVDWDAFIDRALSGLHKVANYLDGKQLLFELYETTYGIHNHVLHSTNPLASVLMHEGEKYLDNYLYDNYLETFLYKKVFDITGLNFDQFLDRPRFEIEKILKKITEYNNRKDAVNNEVLDNLDVPGKAKP